LPLTLIAFFSVGCESKPAQKPADASPAIKVESAVKAPVSKMNVHNFKLNLIDGTPKSLADYKGKALLIVNVASECGYTPQYEPLQELYDRYKDRGLVVLGFPANNFGQQEPGSNEEILAFGQEHYGVTFPLFEKVAVKGSAQAPLYQALTEEGGAVTWNFNKFLIAPDGSLVEHFESNVKPMSSELVAALESVLPTPS
jgi:glutathione peroxidase